MKVGLIEAGFTATVLTSRTSHNVSGSCTITTNATEEQASAVSIALALSL